MVLTIQGLCPSDGMASSISGCVLTKLSMSSGKELEELNLDPSTAQPPGLETQNKSLADSVEAARRSGCALLEASVKMQLHN